MNKITKKLSIIDDIQREQDIYELAIDIARQIFPIPQLLIKYNITEKELEELYNTSVFKEIIKQATGEWNAASSTHKRTKLKAAVIVEQTLPTLLESMVNTRESLAERVRALDTVAKIAGLNSGEGSGGPVGSTFKLSINLNAGGMGEGGEGGSGGRGGSRGEDGDRSDEADSITLEMGEEPISELNTQEEIREEYPPTAIPRNIKACNPHQLISLRFSGIALEEL